MSCVGFAKNVSQAPLIKSIETSPGCDSHRPRVSTIKQNWESVNVIQAEFGWKRDGCPADRLPRSGALMQERASSILLRMSL